MAVAARRGAPIYEGTRIPSPIPTVLQVDPALREEGDILEVNFGPNHPSTHGVLRLIVDLNGERVEGIAAVIGYLHTGFEKNMEAKTYWKGITYAPRIDYVSYQNNELVYVLAVEKLLGIEVPPKATWMRMLLCELNRIHSHLVYLGTSALELGAVSMFWYCFRERDAILDLFEMACGFRMHTRYFQVGGLAEDIPPGFYDACRELCDTLPARIDEYEQVLTGQKIWLERTEGIGLLSAADAIALGQSGPNHPSTHGVLRLIVDLDGEQIAGLSAVVGYLHTGFEKNMEAKTYWKAITYAPRIDYVSFQNNELVFVLAIEKLLGIEVPAKATWMRTLLCELNRLHSHLIWLGTGALELGAISMLWYCFREREAILDLFELVAGFRMHTRYFQTGGLAEDVPVGFWDECRKFADVMPARIDDYEALLDKQAIFLERTKGIGLLSSDDALALGQSGPVLRASGVNWDLRKREPYLAYDELDWNVPVYTAGDVYDRYKVRLNEMRESVRIVQQCLDGMPQGPWIADNRKVVLPPRHELHTSMESLIHHFKLVTEGYRVPEGEVYIPIESPRGELGCYLVADGGPRPWRVKFRAPSYVALEATATVMTDALVADLIAIVGSLDNVMGEVDR